MAARISPYWCEKYRTEINFPLDDLKVCACDPPSHRLKEKDGARSYYVCAPVRLKRA